MHVRAQARDIVLSDDARKSQRDSLFLAQERVREVKLVKTRLPNIFSSTTTLFTVDVTAAVAIAQMTRFLRLARSTGFNV